jgi:hypothetical protein
VGDAPRRIRVRRDGMKIVLRTHSGSCILPFTTLSHTITNTHTHIPLLFHPLSLYPRPLAPSLPRSLFLPLKQLLSFAYSPRSSEQILVNFVKAILCSGLKSAPPPAIQELILLACPTQQNINDS